MLNSAQPIPKPAAAPLSPQILTNLIHEKLVKYSQDKSLVHINEIIDLLIQSKAKEINLSEVFHDSPFKSKYILQGLGLVIKAVPAIKRVDLSRNSFNKALATPEYTAKLHQKEFTEGLILLGKELSGVHLESLNLQFNNLGIYVLITFLENNHGSIDELKAMHTELRTPCISFNRKMPGKIRHLNLTGNWIGSEWGELGKYCHLFNFIKWIGEQNIEAIDVRENYVVNLIDSEFSQTLPLGRLRVIHIDSNGRPESDVAIGILQRRLNAPYNAYRIGKLIKDKPEIPTALVDNVSSFLPTRLSRTFLLGFNSLTLNPMPVASSCASASSSISSPAPSLKPL